MVNEVYKMLNTGIFAETRQNNPFFKKTNTPYTYKLYADATVKINNAIKQQQHRSPE